MSEFCFLTSGESHGMCLNAIIEGVGANFKIDNDFINQELAKRQCGYGRGARMKIEKDEVLIKSGVRFGKTIGSPICLEIKNNDWENWKTPMSVQPVDLNNPRVCEKVIDLIRPGHADYPGAVKFNQTDIRNILERSSARETAARVAVGAFCQNILMHFGIKGYEKVLQIGTAVQPDDMKKEIDRAKEEGETLGGIVEVIFKGLPVGLGSHTHWDRRLDGLLAQAVMSVPAIKGVEIGLGMKCASLCGSKVHDEIFFNEGKIKRSTNNAGGLEGGMTNGEPLVIRAAMKPIPTMKKQLQSVNINTKEPALAHFERSDTCAVEACSVVVKNMVAITLLKAFFEKFGSDSFEEVKRNYESYLKTI